MNKESYYTLYVVFLILAIVFFILTVILFFVFDIRKIISIKSGYAVKQSIKETNQMNQIEDTKKRKKYKGSSFRIPSEELISQELISEQLRNQKVRTSEENAEIQEKQDRDNSTEKLSKTPVQDTVLLDCNRKEEKQGTVLLSTMQQKGYDSIEIKEGNEEKYVFKEGEFFEIINTEIIKFSDDIINAE